MNSGRIVSVWDVEHNELSETISFKVTCDQEVVDLMKAITYNEDLSLNDVAFELGKLLERSIHMNLPRSHRFWSKNKND